MAILSYHSAVVLSHFSFFIIFQTKYFPHCIVFDILAIWFDWCEVRCSCLVYLSCNLSRFSKENRWKSPEMKTSVYCSDSEGTDGQSAKPSPGSSLPLAWAAESSNALCPGTEQCLGSLGPRGALGTIHPAGDKGSLGRGPAAVPHEHSLERGGRWQDEGLKGQIQKWYGRNWQRLIPAVCARRIIRTAVVFLINRWSLLWKYLS